MRTRQNSHIRRKKKKFNRNAILFPVSPKKSFYLAKLKLLPTKLSIVGFTIKQMIDLGIHYGHNISRYHYKLATFLIGFRNYIHIINLEYTYINLRKTLFFLSNLCRFRGTVLFPNKGTLFRDIIQFQAQSCRQPYIYQYYLGGVLTNLKKFYWIIRFLNLTTIIKLNLNFYSRMQKAYKKFNGLTSIKRIPDCIILFKIRINNWLLREAIKLKIPLIGIVDSNVNFAGINYTIFGNDDSLESNYFYSSLFNKAIREGYAKTIIPFDDRSPPKQIKPKVKSKFKKRFKRKRKY